MVTGVQTCALPISIARCALVGVGLRGTQEPALVVQPVKELSAPAQEALVQELRGLARQHPHTVAIHRFFFHPAFPVDVRHNAKIHRLKLAAWAAGEKGYEIP